MRNGLINTVLHNDASPAQYQSFHWQHYVSA